MKVSLVELTLLGREVEIQYNIIAKRIIAQNIIDNDYSKAKNLVNKMIKIQEYIEHIKGKCTIEGKSYYNLKREIEFLENYKRVLERCINIDDLDVKNEIESLARNLIKLKVFKNKFEVIPVDIVNDDEILNLMQVYLGKSKK